MVDRSFADLSLAALYDSLNPWGPCDDFYLGLVLAAGSVLDVGCGTGQLLRRARAAGHAGRLLGLDPAAAMLVQARAGEPHGIEWVLGDLRSRLWRGEFDLVVMTGHAFQVLVGEEELSTALRAVRAALAPGGRFVFDTRHPAARAWEGWTPERVREISDGNGGTVRVRHRVETPVAGDRVTFTETFEHHGWPVPRTSRTTLRFLGPELLTDRLAEAGLAVEAQYGHWDRRPLTPAAPEIITVARAA
ncbi:class I SAM-dependent methyltransferase [Streptomyces mangrovisoli]|uniref:Methyltransferase n=1 Tax=Streptomyces mangrovisoli TaxID=1428628 RepID=A0A1J4NR70_9ACTN|nr:class I SAM-dependent methyltransferase [Streptomyces mangrovisoli]OIJ64879.1 methyltransferase [Streptomyces mangrovisoli]